MKFILFILAGFLLLYFNQPEKKQYFELTAKQKAEGWYLEPVEGDIAKVMHPAYGYLKHVKLTAPELKFSKTTGQNIQAIDLRDADTSLYSGMFVKKDFLPASGSIGYPVQIGDYNNNGLIDFNGAYKWIQDFQLNQACVVEFNTDSNFVLKKIYYDSLTRALPISDLNKDNRQEMNFRRLDSFAHLKNTQSDSFPDSVSFLFSLWQWAGQVSGETLYDLDKDGQMDLLYMGDDTLAPWGHKIFIAEYNDTLNNFEKTFRFQPDDWRTAGFAVADWDNNSFLEFAVGSIHGDVNIFENDGDNSYKPVFTDTISTSNAYLSIATNDLDNNGKKEYIIGGSSYFDGIGGTRFYWYEADDNNSYTKVRSFFLLGVDPLSWDEIHVFDANNDGKDDILINYTYAVVILAWNNVKQKFEVYHLSYWDSPVHGVTMYDLNNDGKLDLFISVNEIENVPARRTYYFINKTVTAIGGLSLIIPAQFKLLQNFPNPFNRTTTIPFKIENKEPISITIYNSIGKEVRTLLKNNSFNPGEYSVSWDGLNNYGKEMSSGLYYVVMKYGAKKMSRKMLMIK